MSKFKVGDRVFVYNCNTTAVVERHKNIDGTVVETFQDDDRLDYRIEFDFGTCELFYESELEFSEVIHSPLYEALK